MQEFINASGGLIPATLILVLATNAALTGLRTALEFIQDKTETKLDNQAFQIISKISGLLAGLVDILSANKKH